MSRPLIATLSCVKFADMSDTKRETQLFSQVIVRILHRLREWYGPWIKQDDQSAQPIGDYTADHHGTAGDDQSAFRDGIRRGGISDTATITSTIQCDRI